MTTELFKIKGLAPLFLIPSLKGGGNGQTYPPISSLRDQFPDTNSD